MYVHVDIKKIMNKYKNISKKMSEYVGFSPPPTYFLHIYAVISDCCKTKQAKPSSVCRKYVGGGENPTYSLIFLELFLYLHSKAFWPKLSSIFVVPLLRNGRCYEAEIWTFLLLLICAFAWNLFLLKSNFSVFGRKPWIIVRRFGRN